VLELGDHTPDALLAIQHAETVDDVLAIGPYPSMLSQNFVAADTEGHIAWQVVGSIPRRQGYSGRVPYPASKPGLGWDGWVALRPGLKDPPQGYVHTANSRPDHPEANTIGTGFMPPWRQDRIGALIEATEKHAIETVADAQLDLRDTHAEAMLPVLLEGVDPDRDPCTRSLHDWDYETDSASRGAAVWAVFHDRLVREVLRDRLDAEELDLYAMSMTVGQAVVDAGMDHYVEDQTGAVERALDATCVWLTDRLGPDATTWTWGELHPLNIRHPFSAATKLLSGWDMPTVPYPGNVNTVNVGGYLWHGEEPLETNWLASMRLIVPMSDPGQATFANPGGQSGHPGHPHYDDLFNTHVQGGRVPLWFHDEDVREHAVEVLELVPSGPPAVPNPTQSGASVAVELGDFDRLWVEGDPALTESRLQALLPAARAHGSAEYRLQLETQIARTLALQGRFDEALAILDAVDGQLTEETPTARERALLERERVLRLAEAAVPEPD
jgi:penicillin amidase